MSSIGRREVFQLIREVLDLSVYEAKVYLLLLAGGTLTVGELSRRGRIPKSKVYEALKSLALKGLVVRVNSSPLKYSTVPVRKGIYNRLFQLRMELARKERLADELIKVLEGFEFDEGAVAVNLEGESFKTSLTFDLMIAREEVLLAISELALNFSWPFSYISLNSSVNFKFLTPKVPPLVKYLIDNGLFERVEIKDCDYVRQPFLVIDEKITYLIIISDSGKVSSVIRVEDKDFSEQMAFTFRKIWEKCEEGDS